MKRVFLIVLDSLGIGQMPDADRFGDFDCNTLKRISKSEKFNCENLRRLGIGNIDGIDYIANANSPAAAYGRMSEASKGKDTTIGHWEIAGIITNSPLPTYPNGFPNEIIAEFEAKTGKKVVCNKPFSGTEVIKEYGDYHLKTGDLIVYTSADSVFQIAAHTDIVPTEELYRYCEIAREILKGENAVGRVIARPFFGEYPYKRSEDRRDFSLKPTSKTLLDAMKESSFDVISIGKISDIFAGQGITKKIPSHSNFEGMQILQEVVKTDFCGLCFANLVDFDMKYGHRQDTDGYAAALSEFDAFLPNFIAEFTNDDILFITADHGCDPGDSHTDHTREYTPLLVYSKSINTTNLGTRSTFSDIAATIADIMNFEFECEGESFKDDILG